MSRRMGRLKMLLPFGDRPMLARVIESLLESRAASPIIVVTGHAAEEISAVAVEYKDVVRTHNPDYATGGMLSSVKTGVRALPPTSDAFYLVLGDQPMVRPSTLIALRAAWHPESVPIVAPAFQGKRGHPLLISSRLAEEILELGEDDTLKTLIVRKADKVCAVPVDDPATVQDVDTPDDYQAALRQWREMGVVHG